MWFRFFSIDDRLSRIAAGRNRAGQVEVFGTAHDLTVWHAWQIETDSDFTGNWTPFYSDADRLNTIKVIRNANGRLEAFGLYGVDEWRGATIWHTRQVGDSGQWDGEWVEVPPPENQTMNDIYALPAAGGGVNLFGLSFWESDHGGNCWHMFRDGEDGAWGEWHALDRAFLPLEFKPYFKRLALSENQDGRIEMFAISNGNLYQNRQSSPGGEWEGWRLIHRYYI